MQISMLERKFQGTKVLRYKSSMNRSADYVGDVFSGFLFISTHILVICFP